MTGRDLSVVIPAFNAVGTLEATVRSALGATGLLEIVVVDDGSTDGTGVCAARLADELRTAGGPPLHLRAQPKSGPAAARNRGASVATGDVLGFLDADDIWLARDPDPRRAALEEGCSVALGLIQCVAGEPPEPIEAPYEGFQLGAALIRRAAFEAVGPFDAGVEPAEDLDWFLRAREIGVPLVFASGLVLGYRLRPGSLTARRSDRSHALLHALHRSVDRRRESEGPRS